MEDASFNRLLLEVALSAGEQHFDPQLDLLVHDFRSAKGTIHTALREGKVHPFRESTEYALYLLENGNADYKGRAERILRRVLSCQDTDTKSRTYGIWSYYWEESLTQMNPPDWNWADFIGAVLLIIEIRHGPRLSDDLSRDVRQAIGHAARSIERRNITMHYTNIAVKGTFVTLAAAEVLGWKDLWEYASNRIRRLAATIDESGSFSEFNSPTYMAYVTITNLTRILMFVRDQQSRAIAEKIHERAWLHVVRHWHPPTRQISGPMSRCYISDLREDKTVQLILQKATRGALQFYENENIPQTLSAGTVAVHDYHCPENLIPQFLELSTPHQHRELFTLFPIGLQVRPHQGTTWLEHSFSLGTCNCSTFWNQSRPLLAYWLREDYSKEPSPPGCYIHLRFLKDGFDFCSANVFTVQDEGSALAAVNFSSPAGDRHLSLDMIRDGVFETRDLRVNLMMVGARQQAQILCNGEEIHTPFSFKCCDRMSLDLEGAYLGLVFPEAYFGEHEVYGEVRRSTGETRCDLVLFSKSEPEKVYWNKIEEAFAATALMLSPSRAYDSLEQFDEDWRGQKILSGKKDSCLLISWETPKARLDISCATVIQRFSEHIASYNVLINGSPPPIVRLAQERIFV